MTDALLSPSKKPNLYWAFLFSFLSLFSSLVRAEISFKEVHWVPVKEKAFDSSSQQLLAAGVASLFLAQTLDSEMKAQWGEHRTMSEPTAEYGNKFGTYAIGPAIAIGQYFWDRDNGFSHLRALAYTGLVTQVLKESVGRRRPDGSNHLSMPSGHSSSAFTTATSLTYAYGWKAGMVTYPVAIFVALSRVADDVHWFSDIVAGAFIGLWMGRATFYSTSEKLQVSQSDWQFLPIVEPEYKGILFSIRY